MADKSLSAQAANLKRSIQKREQRRNDSLAQRYINPDVYEDQPRAHTSHNAAGSAAVAALAAISAATALRQPEIHRCELCQATFTSEPQYAQHLAGPVHKKAEEKRAAEVARRERLGKYGDLADAAVAAGNWQSGHNGGGANNTAAAGGRPSAAAPHAMHSAGAPASKRPRHQDVAQEKRAAIAKAQDALSHDKLVAAAQADTEVLHIDGWVPPSIPMSTSLDVTEEVQQTNGEQQTSSSEDEAVPAAGNTHDAEQEGQQEDTNLLNIGYGDSDEDSDNNYGSEPDEQSEPVGAEGAAPKSYF